MARSFVTTKTKIKRISPTLALAVKLASTERERSIERVEKIYVEALERLDRDHLKAITALVKQYKGDKNSQLKQIMIGLIAGGTDRNDLLCLFPYMEEDGEYADAHPGQAGQLHKDSVAWLTLLENRYFQVFHDCVELY